MAIETSRRSLLAGGAAALLGPQLVFPLRARAQDAAAPLAALAYPRRIGELEVTAISDGFFQLSGPMFVNISDADLQATLEAAFIDPAAPPPAGVTAHLVRGGGRTMLIDTGTADLFGPTLGRLPATLAALGVAPEDVDTVLLTHLHPDHVGGMLADGAPAFPNAAVHVSAADLAFWTDESIAAQAPEDFRPFFARVIATAAAYGERITPFGADGEVLPGVTSMSLPGHTVGHAGFLLDSGGETMLVFGDAAIVAAVQFRHPEAGYVFDTDAALGAETRKKLFDMAATDRLLMAGTHLPFPGVGHVVRSGETYAWAPEEWRLR